MVAAPGFNAPPSSNCAGVCAIAPTAATLPCAVLIIAVPCFVAAASGPDAAAVADCATAAAVVFLPIAADTGDVADGADATVAVAGG